MLKVDVVFPLYLKYEGDGGAWHDYRMQADGSCFKITIMQQDVFDKPCFEIERGRIPESLGEYFTTNGSCSVTTETEFNELRGMVLEAMKESDSK